MRLLSSIRIKSSSWKPPKWNLLFSWTKCCENILSNLCEKWSQWNISLKSHFLIYCQNLTPFWNFEKTVLHEIHVSGTVGGPLLTQKSPTCTYIFKPKTVVVEIALVIFVLVIPLAKNWLNIFLWTRVPHLHDNH